MSKIRSWFRDIAQLFILALGLGFIGVLATFYPLYFSLPVLVMLPVVVLLLKDAVFFERLKLSTLIVGRTLVILGFLGFMPGGTLTVLVLWLLRLNILEAILTDLKTKNYLNVLSGALLLISSAFISIEWSGVYYFTDSGAFIFWILAYTLWNWNFVLFNFNKSISVFHLAVLASPLLAALLLSRPELWLILRGSTLTFAGLLQLGFRTPLVSYFKKDVILNSDVFKSTRLRILNALAVGALVLLSLESIS